MTSYFVVAIFCYVNVSLMNKCVIFCIKEPFGYNKGITTFIQKGSLIDIITLFCEIDDFFLTYQKWMTTHGFSGTTPWKHAGVREAAIQAK